MLALLTMLACKGGAGSDGDGDGDGDGTDTGGTEDTGTDDGTSTSTDDTDAPEGDLPKLDVGPSGDGDGDECQADDMDEVMPCVDQAPPLSFEPEVQWAWEGQDGEDRVIVTPLVANLTDDDDNGEIDVCDTPDIIVPVSGSAGGEPAHIYVLDGETGSVHFRIDDNVYKWVTPAIGDIDGDGLPEIVAARWVGSDLGPLIAFEHDGEVKWQMNSPPVPPVHAIALADLDADGDVEIMVGDVIYDHEGELLWDSPEDVAINQLVATTAADLDGDDDLEFILGHSAYHHDGTPYYMTDLAQGAPQVADLDDDGLPEVLLSNIDGLSLLEHDGTVVYQDLKPTGDADWRRPAAIHDMDGDSVSEFAVGATDHFTVYEADASIVWSANISDKTGLASGTAFDFLGDGVAEAMYADETTMYVFGDAGEVLLQMPRGSSTLVEYPVVADVDNDGSAEIVVTSNQWLVAAPPVQVIRDVEDRWIQARRIWNQHTYHVTNVREDGTIPQIEPKSWLGLNTFRTNAQIEGGSACQPEPEG